MMGRYCGSCCGGGGCFGVVSLTTYMIASKTCGSIVIVHCPIFVMESLGGFLSSSTGRPSLGFFFEGLVQYFSKMPSLSHFLLDRSSDSAKTRLFHKKSQYVRRHGSPRCMLAYLSAMDWYSLDDRSSGCGCSTVGSGLPGTMLLGRGSFSFSTTTGTGVGGRAGSRGGVDVRFLLAASTRDEVRAGSLRFLLSILGAAAAAAEIGDGGCWGVAFW